MSLKIIEKGLIGYEDCLAEMISLIQSRPLDSYIWHVEHAPVFTLGISEKSILENKDARPPIIKTDRGGKITYHGPGQLIYYFMLNLKKMPFKPTKLTQTILTKTSSVFENLKINHNINLKDPGIYIREEKVASIGMRIKQNYSYHGISINWDTDLNTFNSINPCGLDIKACNLKEYIDINKKQLHALLSEAYKTLEKE